MAEESRERMALFRFGLIAPVLNGYVKEGGAEAYFRQLSKQTFEIPGDGVKSFCISTFRDWLRRYRKGGIEALMDTRRSDYGKSRKLTKDEVESILKIKRDRPDITVEMVYQEVMMKGITDVSKSTIYRLLEQEGLMSKDKFPKVERRRFEAEKVNDIWQSDVMIGPYVTSGMKKRRSALIVFLDDKSRVVTHGEFYYNAGLPALIDCLKKALLKRGIPRILYVDNAKIYHSHRLQFACAFLGINLVYTKPYTPESKGKIERFIGSIRTNFIKGLDRSKVVTLLDLNKWFMVWVEEYYHRKFHRGIGTAPIKRWSEAKDMRFVDDRQKFNELFYERVERRVNKDLTIRMDGKLYEVDGALIGKKIEVRYDPVNKEEIFIWYKGKYYGKARLLNPVENLRVKRRKGSGINTGCKNAIGFTELFYRKKKEEKEKREKGG